MDLFIVSVLYRNDFSFNFCSVFWCIMRRDFDAADRVLPAVPKEQRTRVAHFLEKQGF